MRARVEHIKRGKRREKKIEKDNETGNTKYIKPETTTHKKQTDQLIIWQTLSSNFKVELLTMEIFLQRSNKQIESFEKVWDPH